MDYIRIKNMNMKNNNIKIYLIAFVTLFSFAGLVSAESSLYVSPEVLTINTQANINSYVSVLANGEKVCVVKGTISFNNLNCKGIIIAEGLMAQAVPTCSNPNFVVGIPTCTTVNKNLFTVQSTSGTAGSANISLSNINIIGEGVSVGSASSVANYTVKAPQVVVREPETKAPKEETEVPEIEGVVGEPAEDQELDKLQLASTADIVGENKLASFINNNSTIIYSILLLLLIVMVAVYIKSRRS